MYGAKGGRQLLLFEKGIIIAKKKEDGTLLTKTAIMVGGCMSGSVDSDIETTIAGLRKCGPYT